MPIAVMPIASARQSDAFDEQPRGQWNLEGEHGCRGENRVRAAPWQSEISAAAEPHGLSRRIRAMVEWPISSGLPGEWCGFS